MAREMKDSGIEWIGVIPKHWYITKVKNIFHIGRGRVIAKTELEDNGEYPIYSSQTKNDGCLGYISTYDFDKPQLTWTTDGANAGTVFLRTGKYNCTNVCGTLLPKTDNNSLKFLKFSLEYIAIFHKRADINGYKIMNNEMAEIEILLPPLITQQRIADYLDKKCAMIDAVIEKTKATIEEYKKYKKSIITEAVTKGLNSDVEMKDSGIEWAQIIPSHWKVLKGKFVLQLLSRPIKEDDEVITCFRDGEVTLRKNRREEGFTFAEKEIGYQGIEPNDLVIHGMDGFAGAIGISDSRGKSSPVLNVCDTTENKKYIMYYLRNMAFNNVFLALATGIRVRSCDLRWNKLSNFLYHIPPINEQNEIVEFIEKELRNTDIIINKKQQFITELESYKKSLIYECVTGKREIKETYQEIAVTLAPIIFIEETFRRKAQIALMTKALDAGHKKKKFGRTEWFKTLYLLDACVGFPLQSAYTRDNYGPTLPTSPNCENEIFKIKKWFNEKKGKPTEYQPTKNKQGYIAEYNQFFLNENDKIEAMLKKLNPLSMNKVEKIATLYAVWNDFILEGKIFDDNDIVNDVLTNWSNRKRNFSSENWHNTLKQMRELDIIPKGYGKHTVTREVKA